MFKGTQQSSVITISVPEVNPVLSSKEKVDLNPVSSEQPKEIKSSEPEDAPEAAINQVKDVVKIAVSKFYVIGGAFKIRENADNLLTALRSEGFKAEDAGQNPAGLYMVSYFSSENKSEALVNLATIRREKNPSAWLLKK
jgi:cell division septation protein DedD